MSNDNIQPEILNNAVNLKSNIPTEPVTLPSKGKFYTVENPLSSGIVEIYYPTARNENILTSQALIKNGKVIDTFLQSLVVDPNINLDDMLLGDKNALVIASRILAYGADYATEIKCPSCQSSKVDHIDLASVESKELDESIASSTYEFLLPNSKRKVRYKILTQKDERSIEEHIKGMKKYVKNNVDSEITTRLKYTIIELDGKDDREFIGKFVDNELLSRDSLALRSDIRDHSPDVDMNFNFTCDSCGYEERIGIPLGVEFFWPSGKL